MFIKTQEEETVGKESGLNIKIKTEPTKWPKYSVKRTRTNLCKKSILYFYIIDATNKTYLIVVFHDIWTIVYAVSRLTVNFFALFNSFFNKIPSHFTSKFQNNNLFFPPQRTRSQD